MAIVPRQEETLQGLALRSANRPITIRPVRPLRHQYALPLALCGLPFLIFGLMRVGLLLFYPGDFAELTWREVATSFVRGLRFDASIGLVFLALPVLLLSLPIRLALHGAWRAIWGWFGYAVVATQASLAVGDAVYFGYVHRHAGPEVASLRDEGLRVLTMGASTHPLPLLMWFITVAGGAILFRHFFLTTNPHGVQASWRSWGIAGAILPISFLLIRGGVAWKPMNIVNAFEGVSRPAGLLALNGAYAVIHSYRGAGATGLPKQFMPQDEAVALVREGLVSSEESFLDDAYPISRRRRASPPPGAGAGWNIIVVLLEGWDPLGVDSYAAQLGKPLHHATPAFDRIAARGLRLTEFFANGQRSADSFSAVLAGIPTLPGFRYIGLGMEQNRLAYLGRIAKENEYSTVFVRGAYRNSYRLDAIASLAGFDSYYGYEDIAAPHGRKGHHMGSSDGETFSFAAARFAEAQEPFLGFIFTLSTHAPFNVPPDWTAPADLVEETPYLRSLAYSDWALGRFVEEISQAPYFERTILVLVSDHTSGMSGDATDPVGLHRVPCVILAPFIDAGVSDRIGSHVDLVPTLMDLVDWKGDYASLGRSFFEPSPSAEWGSLLVTGPQVSWVSAQGVFTRDLLAGASATRVDVRAPGERNLLGVMQVATGCLQRNCIFGGTGRERAALGGGKGAGELRWPIRGQR